MTPYLRAVAFGSLLSLPLAAGLGCKSFPSWAVPFVAEGADIALDALERLLEDAINAAPATPERDEIANEGRVCMRTCIAADRRAKAAVGETDRLHAEAERDEHKEHVIEAVRRLRELAPDAGSDGG